MDKKKTAVLIFVSFFIFLLAAILFTYPLIFNMNRMIFHAQTPHDSIGTIAGLWYANSPYAKEYGISRTKFYGYPFGVNVIGINYPLTSALMVKLAGIFGPIATYNLYTLFSYPLAGTAMLMLIMYLTKSLAASFLAGFLYAFSPWHVYRTFDQVSLAQIHLIPLFVLAVLLIIKKKNLISYLFAALVFILAAYTDIHIALFCALFLPAIAATSLIRRLTRGAQHSRNSGINKTKKYWIYALVSLAITAAAVFPIVSQSLKKDPEVPPAANFRTTEWVIAFSAKPWFYFVPPPHAFLWKGITSPFVKNRLKFVSEHEAACYPGIVVIVLSIYCVASYIPRKKLDSPGNKESEETQAKEDANSKPPQQSADDTEVLLMQTGNNDVLRLAVISLALYAVFAFILSMPPKIGIGSMSIPMPSIILRALAPPFRFYSRFGLVVVFSMCALAAIGFIKLASRLNMSRLKRLAALIVLLIAFFIDTSIVPPSRAKDISRPPEVIKKLASIDPKAPVCIYPVIPRPYEMQISYYYLQKFHHHPMLNGAKPWTTAYRYGMVATDPFSEYTPKVLRTLGVKYAVVLTDYFNIHLVGKQKFDPGRIPAGFELLEKAKDGYIYKVISERADAVPLFSSGFTPLVFLEDGSAWTAMIDRESRIDIINHAAKPLRKALNMTLINPGSEATMSAYLDGKKIGKVIIQKGIGEFFVPDLTLEKKKHTLTLKWDGLPVKESGELFRMKGVIDLFLAFSKVSLN